ncbi:hypothetical protein EKO04_003438 [Ascochyta lentis]|uniref:Uncharacterized protein n=1 Tax=Ascochyta lentis TaxID=205686 RepID=A0A8H7MLB6_9PLEO|nr:hypothetical protein EKO04_003438 [Ascochyta lentis]
MKSAAHQLATGDERQSDTHRTKSSGGAVVTGQALAAQATDRRAGHSLRVVANGPRDMRRFRSTSEHCGHSRYLPPTTNPNAEDDAVHCCHYRYWRQSRGVGAPSAQVAMAHGHIFFTSGPPGCYQVSQTHKNGSPRGCAGRQTAHAGPDNGLSGIPGLACIVCIMAASSRGPLHVIAISSSGSSLRRSPNGRLLARAAARVRASSRTLHHARSQPGPPLSSLQRGSSPRKIRRPPFLARCTSLKESRLFNLALFSRSLAYALQRAAFAAPSKW